MILTNFSLPNTAGAEWREDLRLNRPNMEAIKTCVLIILNRQKARGILNANPSTFGIILLATLKFLRLYRNPIFVFDLILKNPGTKLEKIVAKCKGIFLRNIDHILAIHKDTSGYEKKYGLKSTQFIYIPFKANNFDSANESTVFEGDYLVALGASQRDYPTFLDAVKNIDLKAIIVCSDAGAAANNADLGHPDQYPPNVSRIKHHVSTAEWYQWIAQSKFVVVPIKDSAIQPAGISVYLEAMRLRKATIVSAGASSNGILVQGETALVVPAGDAAALHSAINLLNTNDELRKSIADRGYEYAKHLRNDARMRKDIAHTIAEITIRNTDHQIYSQ